MQRRRRSDLQRRHVPGWKRLTPAALALAALLSTALLPACGPPPPGPRFESLPLPSGQRSRVVVYRGEDRSSLTTIGVTLDGQRLGRFRAREYETIEIAPGSHRLRAGLRGFAFTTLGWNEHRFRARPGEIVFLELQIRLNETNPSNVPQSRDQQIPGNPDQRASENVFIIPRSRPEALSVLPSTRRIGREE